MSVGYSEQQSARRVTAVLQGDWAVNVGTAMPLSVLPYVSAERDVIFHSENGIIGMGPELEDLSKGEKDLKNAGWRPVSQILGVCFVSHADSFALDRDDGLDATLSDGYEAAENDDPANWNLPGATLGSIGGAMDLVAGARRVFVMMSHVTADGRPEVVKKLTYPDTGRRCVRKCFTNLAVISVTSEGLRLVELAPGVSLKDVQAVTDPTLTVAENSSQH